MENDLAMHPISLAPSPTLLERGGWAFCPRLSPIRVARPQTHFWVSQGQQWGVCLPVFASVRLCMYVCMRVLCVCVCACIFTCLCVSLCVFTCVYCVHACTHTSVWLCPCMCVYVGICACVCSFLCICLNVCLCPCKYVQVCQMYEQTNMRHEVAQGSLRP